MLHDKFEGHGSGKEDFCFHIPVCAWRSSWSCDLDHLYKLYFPLPKEDPYEIWL